MKPARRAPAPGTALAERATLVTLVVTGLLAVIAHLVFLRSAGGLWRDEANTLAFARMPSLAAIWAHLRYDSFPLASTLLVRAWLALGFGSDLALRALGCLIGCLILAALYFSARIFRAAPVCSLLVLALNVWVIRGGDSIRPTGVGMLFIVLTFASLGAVLRKPGRGRAALASLFAVLSVQSLYTNAPLVLGICLGGMVVGLSMRSRMRVLISAGIGAVAALSLVPYLGAIRAAREWAPLVQIGSNASQFGAAFTEAAAPEGWLWLVPILAAVVLTARRLGRPPSSATEFDREFSLFALVTLGASTLAIAGFWKWSGLALQPWYFLPWMALAAAGADAAFGPALRAPRARLAMCGILLAAAAIHLVIGWGSLRQRQSNVDLIAAKLHDVAGPSDLVVVNPWYYGVAFNRYDAGPAPWITVPSLEDHTIHRIDLLKRAMETPEITDTTIAEIEGTLRRGGTVWLVGGLPTRAWGPAYRHAPRAPAPGFGWSLAAYTDLWSYIVLVALREHASRVERVSIPTEHGVNWREEGLLLKATGWR